MNRINLKLQENKKLVSIYFTAGYPNLSNTVEILKSLESSGVDMIEIGIPYSDPLADGPTIQETSTVALKNGMTLEVLFSQLKDIRKQCNIPLVMMGYLNPMLQYGMERFCRDCQEIGIDGLIIPDLPPKLYELEYQELFKQHDLSMIFLITPQTSKERIRHIDSLSDSFIYMVSTAGVTGNQGSFGDTQLNYFKRISEMGLKSPQLVGFGIHNRETFEQATRHQKGGIIGSAYLKHLKNKGLESTKDFIKSFVE